MHITLLFFTQYLQIPNWKCTLICSLYPPNLRKLAKACTRYCDFCKVCKKNMKNNYIRLTLKAHISVMAWKTRVQFGLECVLPWGTSQSKNDTFLFAMTLVSYTYLKMAFLDSCTIYRCCLTRACNGSYYKLIMY